MGTRTRDAYKNARERKTRTEQRYSKQYHKHNKHCDKNFKKESCKVSHLGNRLPFKRLYDVLHHHESAAAVLEFRSRRIDNGDRLIPVLCIAPQQVSHVWHCLPERYTIDIVHAQSTEMHKKKIVSVMRIVDSKSGAQWELGLSATTCGQLCQHEHDVFAHINQPQSSNMLHEPTCDS